MKYQVRQYTRYGESVVSQHTDYQSALKAVAQLAFRYNRRVVERGPNFVVIDPSGIGKTYAYCAVAAE